MASVFRNVVRSSKLVTQASRSFSSNATKFGPIKKRLVVVGVGVAVSTGVYFNYDKVNSLLNLLSSKFVVKAGRNDEKGPCKLKVPKPCGQKQQQKKKECCEYQANIISPLKTNSLFLWITLEPGADPAAVACSAVRLEEAIEASKNPCGCNDEIVAGVGFGPNFYAQVMGQSCGKNFAYRSRKGKNGEMPCTDGDIFVHAKCDNRGQLFDFCKHYMHGFPECSILEFADDYG